MPRIRLSEGDVAGPTLVCVPGAMCTPEVFREAARLSGLEAFGLAWLEDEGPHDLHSVAARVCDAIADLPSVILVGHSIGTPITMLSALHEWTNGSTRIRGLVLSNSGANTRGHGDIAKLIGRIQSEWGAPFWDAFVARCFHTSPKPALLSHVRTYPARLRPDAVVNVLRSQHSIDFVPMLPALGRVNVSVVHGVHDPARTLAHAQELTAGIAGSTLHVLDTGHTSCAEDPVGFAGILRAMVPNPPPSA